MVETGPEQRTSRRFALHLPVSVTEQEAGSILAGRTRDVSSGGAFLLLDTPLQPGSRLEFALELPPEITLTKSIKVLCQGTVIRVETGLPGDKVGVAARIERYEFVVEKPEEAPQAE